MKNKKELVYNMLWLIGILLGVLSIPVTMVAIDRSGTLPGIVSFTLEGKRYESMAGYTCIIPEVVVNCYDKKWVPDDRAKK